MDHALSLVEIGNRDSEEPALTFRSCQPEPPSLSAAPVPDHQLLLTFEWERGAGRELRGVKRLQAEIFGKCEPPGDRGVSLLTRMPGPSVLRPSVNCMQIRGATRRKRASSSASKFRIRIGTKRQMERGKDGSVKYRPRSLLSRHGCNNAKVRRFCQDSGSVLISMFAIKLLLYH